MQVTRPGAAGAAVDVERRAALNGAKLAGLVADRWGPADRRRGAIGATATLIEDGRDAPAIPGRRAWVLADGEAARALGPALASILIYLLMAAVLALKPQGLFPVKHG